MDRAFYKGLVALVAIFVTTSLLAEPVYDVEYFSQEAPKQADVQSQEVKSGRAPAAEDVVTFKEETFACYSKKNYDKFKSHLKSRELTLAQSMLNDHTCLLVPTTEKYKILSIDYSAFSGVYVQFINIKGMEFLNKPGGPRGYWTSPTNVNKTMHRD